jgi:hypothetical protein
VTNEELVAQAVDAVRASGRPVADSTTAAGFLGLKPASPAGRRTAGAVGESGIR